jgi:hypothetical protein
MLFASLFTVYLIINVILLQNLPNRTINTISVHFFDSFTSNPFYTLETFLVYSSLFSSFSLICVMILLLFLCLLMSILNYHYISHFHSPSVSFKSYLYFIWLIWYRMSIVVSSQDLETKSPLNLSFEIKNGLLGVKRDRFVSLIGYVHFDDKKTRSVWGNYFFLFILLFFLIFFSLCNFLIFTYFLYRWWESVGTFSPG